MMRTICALIAPALLLAQSATTSYQTDINGHRTPVASQEQGKGNSTQRMRSVNGRQVPVEQITERVVREDANGKIVERTIQKFDSTGRPAGSERVTVEEAKLPGGGKRVVETRAARELSGTYRTVERVTSETQVSGQTTTTNVTLERPTPNQRFETTERRSTVTTGPTGSQQSTETIDRPDPTGRFKTVQRTESTTRISGNQSTENSNVYQVDPSGRMALTKQAVSTTTKGPGGERTETTVYSRENPSLAPTAGGRPRLLEQRITDRQTGPDGSVRESVSLRLASPSDANKLGAPRTVSETVCTGKCLPAAPAAPAAPANP